MTISNNTNHIPVLVYARVSTKTQDPRSQIVRCEEYCQHHGYQIEQVFQDKYSGGGDFMKRPAMKTLLEYLDQRSHQRYIILFDDLKRFARDVVFHLKLRAALDARDAIPKCLNYNFDDSPEGRFMETIHAAQAELEREQNKRQVIQKQRARLIAGYNAFVAPRGYTKHKDKVHGTIDRPNAEGKIIKKALEQFSTGALPMQIDVARFLKQKKVFGKQVPQRYLCATKQLLTNPFYAGYIEYPKWEVERLKGHHKALISLETFNLNQDRLGKKSNTKRIRRDLHPRFPLRGCVNCALCKRKLTGARSTGNGGYYYKYYCSYRYCPLREMDIRKTVEADDLHREFNDLLQRYVPLDEAVDIVLSIFNQIWCDEVKDVERYKRQQEGEKVKLEQEIEHLVELAANPRISDTVRVRYEGQIEQLDAQIANIEGFGDAKTDHLSVSYRTTIEQVLGVLKNPYEIWFNCDLDQKQKVFYFLFEDNIEYHPVGGFRTTQMSLPVRLFEDIRGCDSVGVDRLRKYSNPIKVFITYWHTVLRQAMILK